MDIKELAYPILSLGCMGLAIGMLLGYASKKFAVEVDERVPKVREALPGANCGGCGFAGCDAYAQAVVEGAAPPNCCAVGGAAAVEKIAEVMGLEVDESEPKKAFVKCNGTCNNAKDKNIYAGLQDCRDAALIPGGGAKACSFGCLGLGSCVKACQFGAIEIKDGIANIDEDKCVGCGACANTCPKNVIELVPVSKRVRVQCNSHDKGIEVKNNCSAGCLGCGLCAKVCPKEAIVMENNLAKVDYEKCVQCGLCTQKCPTKAISKLLKKEA
ncbi:electron transport complex subunit RsxB [Clostridium acetireducens DSM 10703]|uniref:Ion-translocating oxidoreductase complex subunit B n=1 Tax=Clostridium acetireducens DSM 10703 TaxID=1121290 RepID=A0A1E8EY05_9CLOT|nr:electron transport complex subunit RsxB [Clostridium acetireducens DSM 10703]